MGYVERATVRRVREALEMKAVEARILSWRRPPVARGRLRTL
ncbi:MAG: hypothetical protein WKF28_01245 [Rubrobacteraceae bacterium]